MNAPATPRLVERAAQPRPAWALEQAGIHPLLARLYAARGVRAAEEVDPSLQHLIPPARLRGAAEAGAALARALAQGERLLVVADYDCDGATACALALRGLALLGARPEQLGYVVPDRARHGYGLSPAVVEQALAAAGPRPPDWLITVDNGIASFEGIQAAQARGVKVLVTDHHLPALRHGAPHLPPAEIIVNPNQPGCDFPSKALAGVGVVFYVLLATRAAQREQGRYADRPQPRLDGLLDLVALGTVADVVRLDANNRRLVAQGLQRIRAGQMQPGVAALFDVAGREPARASAQDFGFALGPRLNAAGRLETMNLGIECLLAEDPAAARELAKRLDAINRERREVEAGMREEAEAQLDAQLARLGQAEPPAGLALFDEGFHEGVVGIVAARLKDRLHRPTFVFAPGADGALKGSGRSIPGFHLRDALDLVAKREPELLTRFGGHAMAAGATLPAEGFPRFAAAFAQVAAESLDPSQLHRELLTDGPLDPAWIADDATALATAHTLDAAVWGQTFEAPVFTDTVDVLQQRIVAEKHSKLTLLHADQRRDAIWFGHTEALPPRVRLAYRLSVDRYNGRERVQWVVEGVGVAGLEATP